MPLLMLIALTFSVIPAFADGQSNKTESTLTRISMIPSADAIAVTIDVSGPSPEPTSGLAENPPRVYVDFRNVRSAVPRVIASTDMRIVKVRTALHSSDPVITRVVVDLASRMPYRVAREGTRTTIYVGEAMASLPSLPVAPQRSTAIAEKSPEPVTARPSASRALESPSIPPVPPLPAPPAPAPSPKPPASTPSVATPKAPFRPSPTPPVSKDLEKYQRQVSGLLDRLRLQKPLLQSLDSKEEQAADRLQIAGQEIERLRGELVAIKPPDSLRTQHDMLIQSSTLAVLAIQLRLQAMGTNDTVTARNAMSAAAGAVMILDRACADLLCRD
jgi:hypothetical protein